MKRLMLITGLLLVLLPALTYAATANSYDDLATIYDEHIAGTTAFGNEIINGVDVGWDYMNGNFTFFVDAVEVGTLAEGDKDGIIRLLAPYVGVILSNIGGVGSGDEASAYTSAAGVTSRLVFFNLVIPAVQTRVEKVAEQTKKRSHTPRTFAAALSWEDVDFDNSGNGDIYGANIGMAWDNDDITYGFMLPYDYIDFDSFDANRIGLIGFGQYHLKISDVLSASFTGHLNYTYTDMDFDSAGSEDVNMFGGGLSAAITLDKDLFVVSAGASYLYNTDDSNVDDDEQHLLKFGLNTGVRNGDNGVFNVFAVYNLDITNYDNDPKDDDYFEVGMEGSFTLSETFGMTLGYKKVIELEDFDADQIYLGSTWKF